MNQLDASRRAAVIACLVEGTSIRATARLTGVAKNTVTKLLLEAGRACAEYQDRMLNNLGSKRIRCDEIWSLCDAKDKDVPADRIGEFGIGSIWTWTAIDADNKLIVSYAVGNRDAQTAFDFMSDVASRLANRVQLTTDAHGAYLNAVETTFGNNIDYVMLIKKYGEPSESPEKRYSPAVCVGCDKKTISVWPDRKHISTSLVERQNLTMSMHMRRFTRLTNAFSKKVENHIAAISLHFMHYNFVRTHQTLRMTPAMAAGVVSSPIEIGDIVNLIETAKKEWDAQAKAEVKAKNEQSYNPYGPAFGQ